QIHCSVTPRSARHGSQPKLPAGYSRRTHSARVTDPFHPARQSDFSQVGQLGQTRFPAIRTLPVHSRIRPSSHAFLSRASSFYHGFHQKIVNTVAVQKDRKSVGEGKSVYRC